MGMRRDLEIRTACGLPPGEETDMFRVDMSGFKAKGDVATLIGAPKGYQDSVCS